MEKYIKYIVKKARSYFFEISPGEIKKLSIRALIVLSFVGMCVSPYFGMHKPVLAAIGTVASVYSLAFGMFLAFKKAK